MRFIDFFSGIGGFRLGMEMAGHTCMGHCEIDKFADRSYRAMHDVKDGEWYASDITRVEPGELPEADCYCFGFPCQAFSIAGKRRGFEDARGTLFFEVMRLAKERKPKLLFAENVAGLLNHEGGRTFGIILSAMDELGYDTEWQVLNSKHFGVPQNRARVFIVGHLRGTGGRKIFPVRGDTNKNTCRQVIGGCQGMRAYDTDGISVTISSQGGGMGAKTGLYFIDMNPGGIITDTARTIQARYQKGYSNHHGANSGVAVPVLTPDRAEKRQNGRRFKENNEPMFTLTAQDKHGVLVKEATKKGFSETYEGDSINLSVPDSKTRRGRIGKGITNTLDTSCNQGTLCGMRIRKLTPKECFRLQGFPDEYFDRAAAVNSDSQLYKQAGNSVTVNVIYEIARRFEPWEGKKNEN